MEKQVEYETSKDKWTEEHILTKEQLAKLIEQKVERAKVQQRILRQVVRHFD